MSINDIFYIIKWFLVLFVIGMAFLPLTLTLFNNLKDKGYIFSKIIGMGIVSYTVFLIGFFKILKFTNISTVSILLLLFGLNYFIFRKINIYNILKKNIKIFILEEITFLSVLFFWTYVRGNMPDIFGLEKFMDYGFINSILRADYFPPKDMWYAPLPINYYYFGHLITAVLTKISSIPSYISFNLMIATIFAFTFTGAFSIALNLLNKNKIFDKIAGYFVAFILSFGGNLTTIYTFFKPYVPQDNPVPIWKLNFLPFSFPNSYWYPNATRFIPFTIHEFPIYSFVVSDLHGHVLDIPFVLLTVLFLYSIFIDKKINTLKLFFISFLLSVMYMTNAWDGFIYFLLSGLVILFLDYPAKRLKLIFTKTNIFLFLKQMLSIFVGIIIFSLPFSINFKPFVSGIGVLCAPKFLVTMGKIGPFLFEANHCQKSPIWQLILLYGFFYFFVAVFIAYLLKKGYKLLKADLFILILIILSSILIIIPEFIYIKDIYPMHYRANTMFKLVYQSFILLSLSSGYIIIKIFSDIKMSIKKLLFIILSGIMLIFIFIYPFFAIGSFYNNLSNFKSLNGFNYLSITYPQDFKLINWINNNIKGQPIILEANGDSYTEYARISANTGLQTIVGWPVHEWLWRGTYDVVAPRIDDVKSLYTLKDSNKTNMLLKLYNIKYVVISGLEKSKYPNLSEDKFNHLGKVIYNQDGAKLYKINP